MIVWKIAISLIRRLILQESIAIFIAWFDGMIHGLIDWLHIGCFEFGTKSVWIKEFAYSLLVGVLMPNSHHPLYFINHFIWESN